MYVCGVSVCVVCDCLSVCVCVYWCTYVRVHEGCVYVFGVSVCVVCEFVCMCVCACGWKCYQV